MRLMSDELCVLSKETRNSIGKDLDTLFDNVQLRSQNIWNRMQQQEVKELTGNRHRVKKFSFDQKKTDFTNVLTFTHHGGNTKTDSPNLIIAWGTTSGDNTKLAWLSKSYSYEELPILSQMIEAPNIFDWTPPKTKEVPYPLGLYNNKHLSIISGVKFKDKIEWHMLSPFFTFDLRDHLPVTVLDWEDQDD